MNLCEIPLESLKEDFDGTVRRMLDVYNFKDEVYAEITSRLARHDLSRHSAESLKLNPHVSHNKFPPEMIRRVSELLSQGIICKWVFENKEKLYFYRYT